MVVRQPPQEGACPGWPPRRRGRRQSPVPLTATCYRQCTTPAQHSRRQARALRCAALRDSPVGRQQHRGAQVLVRVPPVGWAGGGAAGAEDALVQAIQLGAVLLGLQELLAVAAGRGAGRGEWVGRGSHKRGGRGKQAARARRAAPSRRSSLEGRGADRPSRQEDRRPRHQGCLGVPGAAEGRHSARPGTAAAATPPFPPGASNSRPWLGGLQVGLDVLVLGVEVRHVHHQVLDHKPARGWGGGGTQSQHGWAHAQAGGAGDAVEAVCMRQDSG